MFLYDIKILDEHFVKLCEVFDHWKPPIKLVYLFAYSL